MFKVGEYNARIEELPTEIKESSINFLNETFGYRLREEFCRLHKENGVNWIPNKVYRELHRLLIENICSDFELPSTSWNDYIYPLINKVMNFDNE